jgi:Spy/CpxP family protein refolding chaperone
MNIANEKRLKQAFAFAAALLLTAGTLFAQAAAGGQIPKGSREDLKQSITDQEIQLMRQDLRDQRRQIVAANLPLTTEESARFWPVYDQYIAEEIKINDTRYTLIKEYAANYSNLADTKAAEYIRRTMEIDKSLIDLRLKFIPQFEKVLGERKAAMFVQIDRRVQLMVDLQLASMIPIITHK